jgi:hypothetical protein
MDFVVATLMFAAPEEVCPAAKTGGANFENAVETW